MKTITIPEIKTSATTHFQTIVFFIIAFYTHGHVFVQVICKQFNVMANSRWPVIVRWLCRVAVSVSVSVCFQTCLVM